MKTIIKEYIIFIMICLFIFTGCESKIDEPLENPIKNEHSELYIEGLSVEDVILYFNEVSLDAEYINSGNPNNLQKWENPIYYILNGKYTDEDIKTLNEFVKWLNNIEGFPGMYETKNHNDANMKIYFGDQKRMINIMGDKFAGLDGSVTFWYNEDIIYDAIIFYRNDINQNIRNSVILEEIYNGLGPIQDTSLRKDSIIYSEFSTPQELTPIDELILKILYNSKMKVGMNNEECEKVIREIYY